MKLDDIIVILSEKLETQLQLPKNSIYIDRNFFVASGCRYFEFGYIIDNKLDIINNENVKYRKQYKSKDISKSIYKSVSTVTITLGSFDKLTRLSNDKLHEVLNQSISKYNNAILSFDNDIIKTLSLKYKLEQFL